MAPNSVLSLSVFAQNHCSKFQIRFHPVLCLAIIGLFVQLICVPLPCWSLGAGTTKIERTLAIIKPDGLSGNFTDAVKKTILDSDFRISREMVIELDDDSVKEFYAEHSSKSFFSDLVKYMTSGPVHVMILEKENAIADWRALIGPTDASTAKITHPRSVRAMCGQDKERNCVHGSDSPESAKREISHFFGVVFADVVAEHDEL